MEIILNGEKVQFELEGEKNAYEVVNAIGEFSAKSNPQRFITEIHIDNKEFSFADEKGLKEQLIENIKIIEIETCGLLRISLLSIEQIEKFINLLFSIVNNKKYDESLIKIKDSMSWMRDGIRQIVNIFSNRKNTLAKEEKEFINEFEKINSTMERIVSQDGELHDDVREQFDRSLNIMKKNVNNIKEWLLNTKDLTDKDKILENLNLIIEDIDDIIPRLSNVPLLFQTGEDQEAMNVIQKMAGILERSISLFIIFKEDSNLYLDKFTVKEVSFEVFFETFTNHLKELMKSIENNDSIMMGDLLEYEFVPNVEEIKNIFKKIREEAFTKAN